MRSMTQVVTSPVHGENSLMNLPPLPFHSPRGSSRSSCIDSEVDLVGFVISFIQHQLKVFGISYYTQWQGRAVGNRSWFFVS